MTMLIRNQCEKHAVREREGGEERGRERERELRTLLLKDRDFRRLPILTICPC